MLSRRTLLLSCQNGTTTTTASTYVRTYYYYCYTFSEYFNCSNRIEQPTPVQCVCVSSHNFAKQGRVAVWQFSSGWEPFGSKYYLAMLRTHPIVRVLVPTLDVILKCIPEIHDIPAEKESFFSKAS